MKKFFNRISSLFDQPPAQTATSPSPETAAPLDKIPEDGSGSGVGKIIEDLQTYLAGKARYKVTPQEITSNDSLWSAGHIDSLSYVEFLVFIERKYGVVVPDVQLSGRLNTLEALASFISSSMAPKND